MPSRFYCATCAKDLESKVCLDQHNLGRKHLNQLRISGYKPNEQPHFDFCNPNNDTYLGGGKKKKKSKKKQSFRDQVGPRMARVLSNFNNP